MVRKDLSVAGLLGSMKKYFSQVDKHDANFKGITTSDALMSGIAVFGIKCMSLLQFDSLSKESRIVLNLKHLYHLEKAPSDTYMRQMLDKVNPAEVKGVF